MMWSHEIGKRRRWLQQRKTQWTSPQNNSLLTTEIAVASRSSFFCAIPALYLMQQFDQ